MSAMSKPAIEVNDVLTDPCPQCAIKHLSAALFHYVLSNRDAPPLDAPVKYCVAMINLVEVTNGYKSHLWFAVGALVNVEETARAFGASCDLAGPARSARLVLELGGLDGVDMALATLAYGANLTHATWAAAHLAEAKRELPILADDVDLNADSIQRAIARIHDEFFNT